MNTTINRQQWQEEEALRRFQLISPLLQTGLDDAKRIQLRKKIAEENNISVRSLYRYEKAFSERQLVLCQEKVQVKCAQFPRSCRPGQPARAATDSAIVVRYSASY